LELPRQGQEFLIIDPATGVADDRRYGIRREAASTKEWAPKAAFFVCMNTALMAAQQPTFVGTGINQLDPSYLHELAQQLAIKDDLQVLDTEGGYNLCDTKGAYVSFLNLASVDALSEFMGEAIGISDERLDGGSRTLRGTHVGRQIPRHVGNLRWRLLLSRR
jgi:hypothetical protein